MLKLAVIFRLPLTVIVNGAVVPLISPDQPEKLYPVAGAATRVI